MGYIRIEFIRQNKKKDNPEVTAPRAVMPALDSLVRGASHDGTRDNPPTKKTSFGCFGLHGPPKKPTLKS